MVFAHLTIMRFAGSETLNGPNELFMKIKYSCVPSKPFRPFHHAVVFVYFDMFMRTYRLF